VRNTLLAVAAGAGLAVFLFFSFRGQGTRRDYWIMLSGAGLGGFFLGWRLEGWPSGLAAVPAFFLAGAMVNLRGRGWKRTDRKPQAPGPPPTSSPGRLY
jgi:hypothetical protein